MKYCETCNATYPTGFNTCPKDQTVLRVASEMLPGLVIRDKYEILQKIGSGGMATVYRVKHLAFNEERAIKVVSSKLMDDPNFIKRFRTEAIVTRRLQHPNAVRVDDLDTTDDGRLFMVMEYVKGCDLRQVLQQTGPLPLERALHITWQVSSALATAHQLGITHRDIKPDNILLMTQPSGKDLVKVLDFGIAKVREGAMDVGSGYTATQTGMVVGTPQYISPEQAMGRSGDQIDGRADLYSLGVVIYEMLTGKQPFESDTAMGLLLHHLQSAPTPPHLIRPDLNIPPAISTALMKALEKDPAKRFQNANEMLDALAAARNQAAAQTGAATNLITPTVMAKAITPQPAAMPTSAAATPTFEPTPAAPTTAPAAAKPAPAIDKTVAISAPRKLTPPPKPMAKPSLPPRGRRWVTPALIAVLVLGALGMAVRHHKNAAAVNAESPPVQPVSTPVSQPAPPIVALPTPAPALQETTAKPEPAPIAAKKKLKAEPPPVQQPAQPPAQTQPQVASAQTAQESDFSKMDPDVRRLLVMGKRQFDNGKYGAAMSSFRAVLELDPNNALAQRGVEACKTARQRQSEQVLQQDQPQGGQQGSYPRWRRRQPN